MGYIFVDREKESHGQMRDDMRRAMRGGGAYRNYYGGGTIMRDSYHDGYRLGYRHGWEDNEDDMNDDYRRQRDTRGRFV